MEKSVSKEIMEIWEDLCPRIIALAKQEVGNHFIQDIFSDLPVPDGLPDGEQYNYLTMLHAIIGIVTIYVYVCVFLLPISYNRQQKCSCFVPTLPPSA